MYDLSICSELVGFSLSSIRGVESSDLVVVVCLKNVVLFLAGCE